MLVILSGNVYRITCLVEEIMSIRLQVLTLTDATPPIGKILPFSTFEPMMPLKLGSLDGRPPPGSPTTGDSDKAETHHSDSSDSPLDSSLTQQLPDFTRLPGPAYASVGD